MSGTDGCWEKWAGLLQVQQGDIEPVRSLMLPGTERQKITVTGIVQGVGFRPFVSRMAERHQLAGYIVNTPQGVEIEVEGKPEALTSFLKVLTEAPPPLALIRDIQSSSLDPTNEREFQIRHSEYAGSPTALVSPDVAICRDCLLELFDPRDRRYLHPFINCTNCGPRYTIIGKIPYDRPNTAMRIFNMCPACQSEYDDPHSRRYHAQPNCCPECGPHLTLLDNRRELLAEGMAALQRVSDVLAAGKILALKGLGGFHLAVDATDKAAVSRLRARKNREAKPLAVMVPGLAGAQRICVVSPADETLLASPQSPIVLMPKQQDHRLAENVAPGGDFFGVMLPYTPLHHLILRDYRAPLVMTSGNRSEEPICTGNAEALGRLADIADFFLVHDRDIYTRADDSIVINLYGNSRIIRRSRGVAPLPVRVKTDGPTVLAVGGQLKNTVCLIKGREAFISQHIGDLTNMEAFAYFEETVKHLQNIFAAQPEIIVHDLHPDYISTKWAGERKDSVLMAVQHHHAHLAACLAENMVDEPVIGLMMDGTGFGDDGTIWGGEVLIGDCRGFTRFARFEPMPLPGGDAAVKAPWRTAVGYLLQAYEGRLPDLPFLAGHNAQPVVEQVTKNINCPRTSSCGRLFDAVAAMSGGLQTIKYEAQAAIEFMQAGGKPAGKGYSYEITEQNNMREVSVPAIVRNVVNSVQKGATLSEVSSRFHRTLVDLFVDLARQAKKETGIGSVAISGGVFQNHLLFAGVCAKLEKKGFTLFLHSQTPMNDGCVSLGQAIIGRNTMS